MLTASLSAASAICYSRSLLWPRAQAMASANQFAVLRNLGCIEDQRRVG